MINSVYSKEILSDNCRSMIPNINNELQNEEEIDKRSNEKITWSYYKFDELELKQLYELLKLREAIFIVEQNVPYVDMDDKDFNCVHVLGYKENQLVAYMRVVPLDLFEKGYFSFGRVVVHSDLRGTGLGRELVANGIKILDKMAKGYSVKISSQLYLKDFYSSFGFVAQGNSYIEDRIPHIAMIRKC